MGRLKELLLNLPHEKTLDDARDEWQITIAGKGGHCPCCGKWGKVYRHGISESNARALLWMASQPQGWLDMSRGAPRWIIQTYSFATLQWWRLIEQFPRDEDNGDTKHVGFWRVTELGYEFAKGNLQVPKYVYLYNDTLMDMSNETIFIKDTIGKKFNYDELMSATWGEGNYS